MTMTKDILQHALTGLQIKREEIVRRIAETDKLLKGAEREQRQKMREIRRRQHVQNRRR